MNRIRDSVGTVMLAWMLLLLILSRTICLCEEVSDTEDLRANLVTNVLPHPLDYLSGSMALHALEAVLRSQGTSCRYADLVPVSGSVFKFVYDSTEAYEPLRDAYPFDLLGTAAARNGFPEAHWETGLAIEEAKTLIKEEIDSGRPLISPFLKPDAYHGLNIITGYDYDQGILHVQGAFGRRRSAAIPVPKAWDGPTVSPAGWASNPLFVVGRPLDDTTSLKTVYTALVDEAVMLLKGGRLEYGRHEGEAQYMRDPGTHRAWYGLPAYKILVADIGKADLITYSGGKPRLDFGLVWRVDAMVGLLEHDRTHGSQFAGFLRGLLAERESWLLFELASSLERTAAEAGELRNIFWHEIPDSLLKPEEVLEYVGSSRAIVFALPERQGLVEGLRSRGREVYETLWGEVVVEDSSERRLGAKLIVISIMSRERESLRLLEQIGGHLRTRTDKNWPPLRWRPRSTKRN